MNLVAPLEIGPGAAYDLVRHEVKIPTIAVGNISSADQINTLVLSGRADLCALARPHLANPQFTIGAAIEQGWRELPRWPDQYGIVKPLPQLARSVR